MTKQLYLEQQAQTDLIPPQSTLIPTKEVAAEEVAVEVEEVVLTQTGYPGFPCSKDV